MASLLESKRAEKLRNTDFAFEVILTGPGVSRYIDYMSDNLHLHNEQDGVRMGMSGHSGRLLLSADAAAS
jgi:hypothetical protein